MSLASPASTAADLCDRCGATARTRVTLPSGAVLAFCQLHTDEHADALTQMSATIEG